MNSTHSCSAVATRVLQRGTRNSSISGKLEPCPVKAGRYDSHLPEGFAWLAPGTIGFRSVGAACPPGEPDCHAPRHAFCASSGPSFLAPGERTGSNRKEAHEAIRHHSSTTSGAWRHFSRRSE